MPTTTPIQDVPVPVMSDPDNVPSDLTTMAAYMETRLCMRFANVADRDARLPAPVPGMTAYMNDTGLRWVYRKVGSWLGWTPEPGTLVGFFYNSAGVGSVASSASIVTWVPMDIESLDVLNGHSTSSNNSRYQPAIPGRYLIQGGAAWANNAVGPRYSYVGVNRALVPGGGVVAMAVTTVSGTMASSPATPVLLNGTTDYAEVGIMQTSGAALTILTNVPYQAFMTVTYAGPV